MAGTAAPRRIADDSSYLSHQDRINAEIFKAVEMLGRRLEKSESNRNLLVERLSDLEASALRDEKTGRLYLPVAMDTASLPAPAFQAPVWMVGASVTSTAVACLALALVLFHDPVMPQQKSTPVMADAGGYKSAVLASVGPDSSGWKAIDLKSVSSSSLAKAEIEAAKIKSLVRHTVEEEPVQPELAELEAVPVEPLEAIAPSSGEISGAMPVLDVAKSVTGLTRAEEMAAVPPVPAPAAVVADVEKPIPVVVASKPEAVPVVAVTKTAAPVAKTTVASLPVTEANPLPAPAVRSASATSPAPAFQADPSLPEGVRDLEKRALAGSAEAQHDLATLYASGKLVALDYGRSLYWFTKAAEGGIANAHYNLGVMYHQGLGVAMDVKQALKWYENAAELGHPEAMYNLGIAYVEGVGVEADIARGVSYFKRAADAGVPQAAYNLGVLYESSFIGPADAEKAREWYKKAADMGHAEALEALARLDDNRVPTGVGGAPAVAARDPDAVEPSAGDEGLGEGDISMPGDDVPAAPAAEKPSVKARATPVADARLVAKIQNILISQGLLPGKSTGVLDDKTSDAIRAWQKSAKLPVDGAPSQNLLDFMLYNNNPVARKK